MPSDSSETTQIIPVIPMQKLFSLLRRTEQRFTTLQNKDYSNLDNCRTLFKKYSVLLIFYHFYKVIIENDNE